eukprot:gene22248-29318_t
MLLHRQSLTSFRAPLQSPGNRRIFSKPVHVRSTMPMRVRASEVDLDALQFDMPDIDGDLASIQSELGAEFDENGIPRTFRNARQAIDALSSGVVLVDRSHWGRVRIVGKDRLDFLHNQSTNTFKDRKPGTGCDTVFVTPTARTLDLATVLIGENNAMLLLSPSMKDELLKRFDKYIFPADDVQDENELTGGGYGAHQLVKFKDTPLILANGSGLDIPGYTLIADESVSGDLFDILSSKGCVLMGEDEWDIARVLSGRPAPGSELTDNYNPLEAGLYHAVSGCYVGQETISKLHNLNAVKQQLWGFDLPASVPVGSEIMSNGAKVGSVTSCVTTPLGKHFALGYIKCKSKGAQLTLEGITVQIGDHDATVTSIPFASRNFLDEEFCASIGSDSESVTSALGPGAENMARRAKEAIPGAENMTRRAKEAKEQQEASKVKEQEEKAARLAAMQERLAAYQAQQKPRVQ